MLQAGLNASQREGGSRNERPMRKLQLMNDIGVSALFPYHEKLIIGWRGRVEPRSSVIDPGKLEKPGQRVMKWGGQHHLQLPPALDDKV